MSVLCETGSSAVEDIEVIYDAEVCVKCVASVFVDVLAVCVPLLAEVCVAEVFACVEEFEVAAVVFAVVFAEVFVAVEAAELGFVSLADVLLVAGDGFTDVVSVAFVDLGAEVVRMPPEPVCVVCLRVVVELGDVVDFAVEVLVVPEDDFVE